MGVINNNTLRDLSTNNFPVIKHGNVQQYGVSPSSSENFSVLFPKNSTPLTVRQPNLLNFRGNDFTLETWLNVEQLNDVNFNTGDSTGYCIMSTPLAIKPLTLTIKTIEGNNFNVKQTKVSFKYNNVVLVEGMVNDVYSQKWIHIAISRNNGVNFFLHINGEFVTQNIISVDITNTQFFHIGGVSIDNTSTITSPENFLGYMSDFRISNICRYNSVNFTLPTSKFVTDLYTTFLALRNFNLVDESKIDSNTYIESGIKFAENTPTPKTTTNTPYTLTRLYNPSYYGGSAFLNNSSIQISTSSSPLNIENSWSYNTWFQTTNFYNETPQTIVKLIGETSSLTIQLVGAADSNNTSLCFVYENNSQPATVRYYSLYGYALHESEWANLQIIHKNYVNDHGPGVYPIGDKTIGVFVNGKLLFTPDTTFNIQADFVKDVYIGSSTNNISQIIHPLNGFISSTSLISSAIINNVQTTPETTWNTFFTPQQILQNIDQTYFLLNFSDLNVCDQTGTTLISLFGNLESDSTNLKTNTPNYKFNGTDSYIVVTSNSYNKSFEFPADFTIETWLYYNNIQTSATPGIFQLSNSITGLDSNFTTGITITVNDTSKQPTINIILNNGMFLTFIPQNCVIIPSAWTHIALTRHNGVFKFFFNGVEKRLSDNIYNFPIMNLNLCIGGANNNLDLFTGNITGFRVTKNISRYTSSFIPPTNFNV
jgi:hypothetical protein